jgi:hypothetical protein
MPKSRKKKVDVEKIKNMKYVFVIGMLFVFSLIVLLTPLSFVSYSLSCLEEGGKIVCTWKGCGLKAYPDRAELTIAKTPNYVEVVEVAEKSGTAYFSPSPFAGTYTVLLSCSNGDKIFRLTVG